MSFTVTLLNNTSPENYLYKTTTQVANKQCNLLGETSILDPTLILDDVEPDIISGINYLYIEEFRRYYFVKNIISVRNGIWALYCHVDVLCSWKDELLQYGTGIVKRQEYKNNLYLDDGIFKCYQDPLIQVKVFPSGFTTQEFVLAVAGSEATASDGGSGTTEPGGNVSV